MTASTPQPKPPGDAGRPRPAIRAGEVSRIVLKALRAGRALLRFLLQVLFALIIVFEQWGWRPLAAAVARLARFAPVKALETAIQGLPPYGALAVFVLPSALILPLKLIAIWLVANGHALSAALLFIAAKVAGTAIVARIYQLTEPKLMQLAWFVRLHATVVPRLHALAEWVRGSALWQQGRVVSRVLHHQIGAVTMRFRPAVLAALTALRTRFEALRKH